MFPIEGLLDGLIYKPGLFNNQPLRDYMSAILGEYAIVRNITFGASDMDADKFHVWKNEDLPTKED